MKRSKVFCVSAMFFLAAHSTGCKSKTGDLDSAFAKCKAQFKVDPSDVPDIAGSEKKPAIIREMEEKARQSPERIVNQIGASVCDAMKIECTEEPKGVECQNFLDSFSS